VSSSGYYYTGCLGGRDLTPVDSKLKSLKVGDSFNFRAGFKRFTGTLLKDASTVTNSIFSYKILEVSASNNNINSSNTAFIPVTFAIS